METAGNSSKVRGNAESGYGVGNSICDRESLEEGMPKADAALE